MSMQNFGVAATVGELREMLKDFPDDYTWYGWDDGSLIIEDPIKFKDLGYIENKHSE